MKPLKMLVGALALLSLSAQSKTVLWYRLDGFAVGEKTTASTLIDNLADPGNNQLTCHSLSGTQRGTTASLMPVGTAGLGGTLGVYDPVTGEFHARGNALHFGLDEVPVGTANSPGGMLRLLNGLELTNITVEVIYRFSPGDMLSWSMAPLVMQEGVNASREGWLLSAAGWTGKLSARFEVCDQDGANQTTANFQLSTYSSGQWHHAAFTFDADGIACLYLDYDNISRRTTWAGKRLATFTKAMTVAANNGTSNRTFPGDILEIRISDVALPPSSFLRVHEAPRSMVDSKTVVHVPFTMAGTALGAGGIDMNAVTNAPYTARFVAATNVPDSLASASVKPAEAFRDGIGSTNMVANVAAIFTPTNGARVGTHLRINDTNAMLFAESCTLECFFKTPGAIQPNDTWVFFCEPGVKVFISDSGKNVGKIWSRTFPKDGDWDTMQTTYSVARVDDGEWHHLAYVVNKAAGTATLYIDYAYQSHATVTPCTNIANSCLYVGRQIGGTYLQYFPGWMDEVRITRRALRPCEFLTSHSVPTRPATLVHVAFENNYAVAPYPSLADDGVGVAREGGNVPTFDRATPGDVILDGEDGTDVRSNTYSLRMDGSQVQFPRMVALEVPSFTVECFAKITVAQQGVGFLRQNQSSTIFEGRDPYPRWMLFLYPGYDTRIGCNFSTTVGTGGGIVYDTLPTSFADGKWHHWAVTFASEVTDGGATTNTVTELWRDYVSYGRRTVSGTMLLPQGDSGFTIGANNDFTGWVDELRCSVGVLPPSAFMHARPNGTMVIFR